MSQSLEVAVSEAKVIQDFVKHPGMKLLADRLNKKLASKEHSWLNAKTPEDAELLRQNARAYAALMGTLNEFLQVGAQAEKALLASTSNEAVHQDDASKRR